MNNQGRPKQTSNPNRATELKSRNVGRDTTNSPSRLNTSKTKFLKSHAQNTPQESPVNRLATVHPNHMVKKVDPKNAGDHSPSISTVNKTSQIGISGRSSYKSGQYDKSIKDTQVPTLQFNTQHYTKQDNNRDKVKGTSAHTMYTSLREMHGVGEQDKSKDLDELLDKTRNAYSPYEANGEHPEHKRDAFGNKLTNPKQNVQPYRVNVHSESNKGPNLHKSSRGVEPLVAQSMINIYYRQKMNEPSGKQIGKKRDFHTSNNNSQGPKPKKIKR